MYLPPPLRPPRSSSALTGWQARLLAAGDGCEAGVGAQEREPRLPGLLKMLVWAQDHLDEKLLYPVRRIS